MNTLFAKLSPWAEFAGRILIALIFITAGYGKISGYETTQTYMAAMGVPGALLPLVIITELGGGILLAIGSLTRYAAFALAGFSILSGLLFHADFTDPVQQIMFMKNLAIAGGLILLIVNGAGSISLDGLRQGLKGELR
jgi:putative oxidoreductase